MRDSWHRGPADQSEMRRPAGRMRLTRATVAAAIALIAIIWTMPASATQPWPAPPPAVTDPYRYQDYLSSPTNPSDYSSNMSQTGNQSGNAALNASPQELSGVMGADVAGAWRMSTGRPDVTIAILDDGIPWNSTSSAYTDVITKVRLNEGELPEPQPLTPAIDPAHPYDKNYDGTFDINDFCSKITTPFVCEDTRITDRNSNSRIDPQDLIRTPGFSNGVDTDANGYTDDIAGWDSFENDNDPFDNVGFGHGQGRATEMAAEASNGITGVGNCPSCKFVPVRVGDSYVVEGGAWARGLIYAVDSGANIASNSLGHFGVPDLAQQAVNYAYSKGVTVIAASANEEAAHHNMPAGLEHVIAMNAVRDGGYAAPGSPNPPGYLYLDWCSNRGGKIFASFPTTSCSSGSTANTSGVTGLLLSTAMNRVAQGRLANYKRDDGSTAPFALSPNEIWQLLRSSADDIDFSTPRGSDPPNNFALPPILGAIPAERWHTVEGWDQYSGYGRINARRGVQLVSDSITSAPLIPPEADITSPLWFDVLPGSGSAAIEGRVAANRAPGFTWQLEWAPGVQPDDWPATETWTPISSGSSSSAVSGTLGTLDMATVAAAVNGAAGPPTTGSGQPDPERFALRLRLRVIDSFGNKGEFQKQVSSHDDPDLVAGFPKKISTSMDSSPAFADLDGDGRDDLVVAGHDGYVHAMRPDGSEISGWPAPLDVMPLQSGSAAFTSGAIPATARGVPSRGAPAVADLDGDGKPEVTVSDFEGKVYVFKADGSRRAGFPVRTEPNYSLPSARNSSNRLHWSIAAMPAVGDLDGDGIREIIAGAEDRHVYAWKADGTKVNGWPILLRDPAKVASINATTHRINSWVGGAAAGRGTKIVTTPMLADITGDARPEVIIGSNENYGETPNFPASYDVSAIIGMSGGNGRIFAVNPDGLSSTGVPAGSALHTREFVTGWPVKVPLFVPSIAPTMATGINAQSSALDIDGDGRPEVAAMGIAGMSMLLNANGVSYYGRDGSGRDIPIFGGANGSASPSTDAGFNTGGGGMAASDLNGDGISDLIETGSGPAQFIDMGSIGNVTMGSFLYGAVDLTQPGADGTSGGVFLSGFPQPTNDSQLLASPIAADIDGNGAQEAIVGSGENDVRASDGSGAIPAGWAKYTGSWNMASPAAGDWRGDGSQVVVGASRRGYLFAWNTAGSLCKSQWPRYGHDPANSGNGLVDATLPGVITDIAAVAIPGAARVSWRAPGDDGRCGATTAYEVRYSDSAITDANWNTATPFTETVPAPSGAGAGEAMNLPAWLDGKWIALRARDEAGNRNRLSPSVQVTALPGGNLSGTFANGTYGAIAVYSRADGTVATYFCCMGTDSWSVTVPDSSCGSGGGYSVLFIAPNQSVENRWYNDKPNFGSADCVSAPSIGNDMTIPLAGAVTGYVKDAATSADIDGAVIYAFRASDGQFTGWATTGGQGPGRFILNLSSAESYKLLVNPGAGHSPQWWSGAPNFSVATATASPGVANFSVDPAGSISGYVKDASTAADIDGALVYLYDTSGQFIGWTKSGRSGVGRYSFGPPPGGSYKVLVVGPPSHEDLWSDGAAGYSESTPTVSPGIANFSLREAAVITGTVTQSGIPLGGAQVAAYTSCGCTTARVRSSAPDGSYSIKVVSTSASGWNYRLKFTPPGGQVTWYSNAPGFGGAALVSAPSGGVDQETPP